jgi:putative sigma-54 modulation protein
MKCQVTFRHMKASDPIRQYVEEKVSKLNRLIDEDRAEAHVVLSVEKHQHLAHFELIISGALRVRADEKGDDLYSCIDLGVDKLLSQVRRFRDKVRNRRADSSVKLREIPFQVIDLPKTGTDDDVVFDQPQVVRTETMVAKEMNLQEALVQMDLLNSDLLVYTDRDSRKVNVLHRLPQGQYGLIETHAAAATS